MKRSTDNLIEEMEEAAQGAIDEAYKLGFDEGWAHGLMENGLVFCRDCAKAHMADGALVCSRFGCFNHKTKPDGYCHEGVRR